MDYWIHEFFKAIKIEAMYQSTKQYPEQTRNAWACDLGYDLAQATDHIWCDGYCQDEY